MLSVGGVILLPWALVKMPRIEALIVRGCNLLAGPPFSIGFIVPDTVVSESRALGVEGGGEPGPSGCVGWGVSWGS